MGTNNLHEECKGVFLVMSTWADLEGQHPTNCVVFYQAPTDEPWCSESTREWMEDGVLLV